MYLHVGKGNVIRVEDIMAIIDFERYTSFQRGQKHVEDFLSREDIENPNGNFLPQSLVFVLTGDEIDEEDPYNFVTEEEKEELEIIEIEDLGRERISERKKGAFVRESSKNIFQRDYGDDPKFQRGGEFFLSEEELEEDERIRGKGDYEKIVGRMSVKEEAEVNEYMEMILPRLANFYVFFPQEIDENFERKFFNSEYFCGASFEEVRNILPGYSLYEKYKMVAAFRIHTINEYGIEELERIEAKEGISYVLGFGRIYVYGKKVYYPEKARIFAYVSEFTPNTLLKRIKEEENLLLYVSEED